MPTITVVPLVIPEVTVVETFRDNVNYNRASLVALLAEPDRVQSVGAWSRTGAMCVIENAFQNENIRE